MSYRTGWYRVLLTHNIGPVLFIASRGPRFRLSVTWVAARRTRRNREVRQVSKSQLRRIKLDCSVRVETKAVVGDYLDVGEAQAFASTCVHHGRIN